MFRHFVSLIDLFIAGGDSSSDYNRRCTAIDVLMDIKANPTRFCNPRALKMKMEEILHKTDSI